MAGRRSSGRPGVHGSVGDVVFVLLDVSAQDLLQSVEPRAGRCLRLLFKLVDVVIEPESLGRWIYKMKIDLVAAAGLEGLPTLAVEAGGRRGFGRVDRLVAFMHLTERALKQHVGRIILH